MYESVRPQPVISAARNGIGVAEVKLLKNAYVFMEKEARRLGLEVWMITIGDDLYEMDYADRLKTISEILKRLTKWQGRADIPQYSVNTIELLGSAGLHAHCAALVDDQLVGKVRASPLIRPFCQGERAIEYVNNWQGLSSYLSEERTTQANRSLQGAGIPLPNMKPPTKLLGAGDRVRLSDALKADLIEAGWQRPYSITHWKRKELVGINETPLSPRWVTAQAKKAAAQIEIRQSKPLHVTTMAVAGQISMFPDDRPVTRIRDYGGGFMPPSVAEKVEHHRRRLGFTQVQLAALIGICHPASRLSSSTSRSRMAGRRSSGMSRQGGGVLEKTKINLMNLAPRCNARAKRTDSRCQSPAVAGFRVCRMHGAGGGAPSGARNGNYRHGNDTQASKALRAEMMALVRECRETLDAL